MFTLIEDYIKQTREERRQHLNLNESCIEIGGHSSTVFKGLLAHYLETTIPTRVKILLCHACNNATCSNPRHLYWGTYHDNRIDCVECGKASGGAYKKTQKHIDNCRQMGKKYGGRNKLSVERRKEIIDAFNQIEKKYGWKSRLAKQLGVSHTQVTRYLKQGVIPGGFEPPPPA